MKKLHRMMLATMIGPMFMTFAVVMFVLVMQFLWLYIDDIVGKGLEWYIIAELITYAAANLVPLGMPLVVLLASIMALAGLGEHNELLAMKASGISLPRILAPLFVLALLIAVSTFLFANYALPKSNLKFKLLYSDIKKMRPEMQISEGVFSDGITGYSIRVGHKDKHTGLLQDIMIYDHTPSENEPSQDKNNEMLTVADSGYLRMTNDQRHIVLTLYSGYVYEDITNQKSKAGAYPFRAHHFDEQEVIIELKGYDLERSDETLFGNVYYMFSLGQLTVINDSLKRERDERTLVQLRQFMFSSSIAHAKEFDKPDSVTLMPIILDSVMPLYHIEQQLEVARRALANGKQASMSFGETVNNYTLVAKNKTINLYEISWHDKLTSAAACLIFFFIGAPLGSIIRKGGWATPVVISLVVFLIYYVVSISFKKLARDGKWDVAPAMWMSALVTLPLALFFSYKAINDKTMDVGNTVKQIAQWVQHSLARIRRKHDKL